MEYSRLTIHCFVLVGVIACVFAHVNNASRNCPLSEDRVKDGYPSRMDELTMKANDCAFKHNGTDLKILVLAANTTDEIKEVCRNHCKSLPQSRQCNNEVTLLAENCLNETQLAIFKSRRDFVTLAVEEGCISEGENTAQFFILVKQMQETLNSDIDAQCSEMTGWVVTDGEAYDPVVVSMKLYSQRKAFKECFLERLGESGVVSNITEAYLNGILSKMKCVSESDGSLVFCGTLPAVDPSSRT